MVATGVIPPTLHSGRTRITRNTVRCTDGDNWDAGLLFVVNVIEILSTPRDLQLCVRVTGCVSSTCTLVYKSWSVPQLTLFLHI